jgi:hypothetical protein
MKQCSQGPWQTAVVVMVIVFLLGMAGMDANAAIKITGIM